MPVWNLCIHKLFIEIINKPVFINFYTKKLHWSENCDITQAKVIGDVKYRNHEKYHVNVEN